MDDEVKEMEFGKKLASLRKVHHLSQEELGSELDVTRQTISNWELGVSLHNPEQLKRLSKLFQISIDELLDNDTKDILVNKVSNTEKLAGIIIKILKVIGVLAILYLVLFIIAIIAFRVVPTEKKVVTTQEEVLYE